MKYAHLFIMFCFFVFCTAWKAENKTDLPTTTSKSESEDVITSHRLTDKAVIHTDFSGDWKLNEAKSEQVSHFPLCIFGGGDRMRSEIMKIAANTYFLTVDVASSAPDGEPVIRQEKLTFDGKESGATFVGIPRERSMAKWSDDGQTMTVQSIGSFDTTGQTADINVTEVWKLINDEKSIAIDVKSNSTDGENTMKLIYDKQKAADYRF